MFWKKKPLELNPLSIENLQTYIPVVAGIMAQYTTHQTFPTWEKHGQDGWDNIFYTVKLYLDKRNYIYILVGKEFTKGPHDYKFTGNYEIKFCFDRIERKFISSEFKKLYETIAIMIKTTEAKEKELENAKLYAAILAALKKLSK